MSELKNKNAGYLVLWLLIVVYAISRVLQVFPWGVPMLGVVALHVIPAAAFALIHGTMFYRLRTMLVFCGICLVVGNIFENVGVQTGFPYGAYCFTDVMGPKLLDVPILLGLAYVGMAYLSWTLARLILGIAERPLTASHVVILPLTAAFIMVAWDFCMDPVWSTILHAWRWLRGGPYFGVPVSNFIGWYLHVYVIYQLFALYLRDRSPVAGPLPSNYWRLAILFYSTSAVGNLLLLVPRADRPAIVLDNAGSAWKVTDITAATALSTIFTMVAFALAAWVRLPKRKEEGSLIAISSPRIASE